MRTVVIAVALAGCYSPTLRDCEVTCTGGSCPAGFRCEDNVCRAEGASGPCGSIDDAARGDVHAVDDAGPDLACSHTCYSTTGVVPTMMGVTPCTEVPNNCSPNFPWLDSIDFCDCSVGSPALYLQQSGASASIAVVLTQNTSNLYGVRVNNGPMCLTASPVCPATATAGCAQSGSVVVAWADVVLSTTMSNQFDIYESQCVGAPIATFILEL